MSTRTVQTTSPEISVIGSGQVTVLLSHTGFARKTISPQGERGYSLGKYFDAEVYAVNNLMDLGRVLQYACQNPRAVIVRGIPIGPARQRILRRSVGPTATLRPPVEGAHWVCLDLDSVDCDTSAGPAAAVQNWINDKAPQLRGVSVIWQVSANWGIKPGLRAHLWYWLEESRTDSQVKEWVQSLPFRVDETVFGPVQPHYVCPPLFQDGAVDPLAGQPRMGIIEGSEPALFVPSGDVEAEIGYWEEKIYALGETGGPRHPVINKAGFFLGGWVGSGMLDLSEIEARLLAACENSGAFDTDRLAEAQQEINRALLDGRRTPREMCGWKTGCKVSEKGALLPIPFNVIHILQTHPSVIDAFEFDVRKNEPRIVKPLPWDRSTDFPRRITDRDDTEAVAWLNSLGMLHRVAGVSEAINVVANKRQIDEVKIWLEKLPPWDNQCRLDDFCVKVFGVPSSELYSEIGRRFLISMVARALSPGCKADHMLVLVGEQGKLKSTALEVLSTGPGSSYYSEELGDISTARDYIPVISGPWLVEEAEMSNFSRREIETVKRFLSMKCDRGRLAYDRRVSNIPRRCVFAGTTNNPDFLQDPTGGRRFWPVDVVRVDLGWLKENREQLFAEALTRYRAGEKWYLEDDVVEDAKKSQEEHTMEDPLENKIRRFLDSPIPVTSVDFSKNEKGGDTRRTETTITEVVSQCLAENWSISSRRISAILRNLGWRRMRKTENGKRFWVYARKE